MENTDLLDPLLAEKNKILEKLKSIKDESLLLENRLKRINDLLELYHIGDNVKEEKEAGPGRPKKKLVLPERYDVSLQWNEKVLYLLNACGGLATVNGMVEKLKRIDSSVGENVKELLTQSASRLYREGIIDANRGKPYEYKLRAE